MVGPDQGYLNTNIKKIIVIIITSIIKLVTAIIVKQQEKKANKTKNKFLSDTSSSICHEQIACYTTKSYWPPISLSISA